MSKEKNRMDTLSIIAMEDLSDMSWLNDIPLDIPESEMTPEDEALGRALMKQAKAVTAAKAKLRASKRKKEDVAAGPSQKISIRIPHVILDLLKAQAALRGLPYQTYLNHLLLDAATR